MARAAAEQTYLFYGPVMMTMNSYGTVNAIGANCFFRRKALDSIGGHAAGLSEDMHTAMCLHAKGWKSIYVPKVLSSGLAPATLMSFYKQQLKWSRGTMELLFSVYPRFFKNFTWKQKIHYAVLPLFYLSGFIYMLSFLIPIISLIASDTPWKGNILNFALISFPVIGSIIGIRLYVQNWLIHKGERGIHILGGLLMQCTWWIYVMGVLYAFIRKRVPYIPTDKNDIERTKFSIVVPNLIVALTSLFAIIYGLERDFTPFSIGMSVFALWNIGIMLSTISFAYENRKRIEFKKYKKLLSYHSSSFFGLNFYRIWQRIALLVTSAFLFGFVMLQYTDQKLDFISYFDEPAAKTKVKYLGVFNPIEDNGLSQLKKVKKFENTISANVDIVSLYIPWRPNGFENSEMSHLKMTISENKIPLITWEPWINGFKGLDQEKSVFELINEGEFDGFIKKCAFALKSLDSPVFLRFAHEFDNPFYPWYSQVETGEQIFKDAWRRVHSIFQEEGASQVVWVYNPWKSESIANYFPGEGYVDWFSVNALNYSNKTTEKNWSSFKRIYDPYHQEIKKISNLPVMISELGSLTGSDQEEWLSDAFDLLEYEFDEIYAVVFFNSKVDNNLPAQWESEKRLDWTINYKIPSIENYIGDFPHAYSFIDSDTYKAKNKLKTEFKSSSLQQNGLGVNFKIGQNWNNDYHVLNRRKLLKDFTSMKHMGIRRFRFLENDVYNYNVLKLAKENQLQISYGFWIPESIDFANDEASKEKLKKHIVDQIYRLKTEDHIVSWHLENALISKLHMIYNKPELFDQQTAFLVWLSDLLKEIKTVDFNRPVIYDIDIDPRFEKNMSLLAAHGCYPEAIGLVVDQDLDLDIFDAKKDRFPMYDFIISEIEPTQLSKWEITREKQVYLFSWQDMHESNKLDFKGVLDRKGRIKNNYFELVSSFQTNIDAQVEQAISISILKELRELQEFTVPTYYAMEAIGGEGWCFPTESKKVIFEWDLIKCDENGNFRTVKSLEGDTRLKLSIPKNYEQYRLLLSRVENGLVTQFITKLNAPYYQNNENMLDH